MACFSNDADVLKYEPVLFGELHLPSQVIASGTAGLLSGTIFTVAGADFVSAGVSTGGVVYLVGGDGVLDGAFEIVSVDSAAQLTVSVVRADDADAAVAPPAATDVSYRVSTLRPQAEQAAYVLTEYFGIAPGDPDSEYGAEDVLDTEGLRRASAFKVIASVYATLAGGDERLWEKSRHYERLYDGARARCNVSVDAGDDGVADRSMVGACGKLVRD